MHRGPDDEGVLQRDIGIGMRRLSIIDLNGGAQSFIMKIKPYIVQNGEIYNYIELRQDLEMLGHIFTTHSDTEVLVHLYEEYGVEKMLNKLRGMFCFALYDLTAEKLIIAKDRLGKKPCFYRFSNGCLTFCSELIPLVSENENKEISPEALSLYLANGYIPSPLTIYEDIKKLSPAHYLVWENKKLSKVKYWSLDHCPDETLTPEEWMADFQQSFKESVSLRLRSDVDLGLLLSGGLDSNAVLAR